MRKAAKLEPSLDPHPDLELARRARAGSTDARRVFIERMRCVPRMLAARNSHLQRPLGRDDLEDLSQETLLSIWRGLGSFAGRSTLETWAYRICAAALADHVRGLVRAPRIGAIVTPETPDRANDAETLVDQDRLYRAIDRLDEPDGGVVRLKHFELLTFEEIGERLDHPSSTVKTWYYRGIDRLRDLLRAAERGDG